MGISQSAPAWGIHVLPAAAASVAKYPHNGLLQRNPDRDSSVASSKRSRGFLVVNVVRRLHQCFGVGVVGTVLGNLRQDAQCSRVERVLAKGLLRPAFHLVIVRLAELSAVLLGLRRILAFGGFLQVSLVV